MTLIDANLLLYAYDSTSLHHHEAKKWLEDLLSGAETPAFAWIAILAFMRIGMNPRALRRPFTFQEASGIVSEWLQLPQAVILNPSERHWPIFLELAAKGQALSSHITDAHLAVLALEHGATLATADRGFARFPGLRMMNPLAPA